MSNAPTIGVIIDTFDDPYQETVWQGICSQASDEKVNILSFVTTVQNRKERYTVHYDLIRDLATSSNLDGVIVMSGSIAEHQGITFAHRYCYSLAPMPVVSVSLEIPGVSSIAVDNRTGIVQLVTHMVQKHGASNIAFIRGPSDHSEENDRFEAYIEGLRNNSLPVNPQLILPGDFSEEAGARAVQILLNKKIPFDTILTIDDVCALGAIKELKKNGLHVPADVAVAGFDDIPEAKESNPALTTVKQPLAAKGMQSIKTMIKLINRQPVVPSMALPTEPVFRRSCGCTFKKESADSNIPATAPSNSNSLVFKIKIEDFILQTEKARTKEDLATLLQNHLSELGINSATVALWDEENRPSQPQCYFPPTVTAICRYDKNNKENNKTNTGTLLKRNQTDKQYLNDIILPLHAAEQQMGYIILEHSDGQPFSMYEQIRFAVSNALLKTY
jgi:DNA-binding LacI/PurR family transcriptional regulator